jgi:hypothetical protein
MAKLAASLIQGLEMRHDSAKTMIHIAFADQILRRSAWS